MNNWGTWAVGNLFFNIMRIPCIDIPKGVDINEKEVDINSKDDEDDAENDDDDDENKSEALKTEKAKAKLKKARWYSWYKKRSTI